MIKRDNWIKKRVIFGRKSSAGGKKPDKSLTVVVLFDIIFCFLTFNRLFDIIYCRFKVIERWFAMTRNVLQEIKQDLDSWVGRQVEFRANRGRKKILCKEGILESTYPHIFVVKVVEEGYPRRVSFTYADVLTESVEIIAQDRRIGLSEA